ncbi:PSD1 and planctomycete cytochrome C domain-containing protein [Blastopirellula retiformator]|uniref:Planctomycete cytochrome C n=1 Tax=Blastopirellula retiformator TaxID=2527970 RepID=A0A5C5VLR3_9BACT|nr:PSD1 and planctomycete cytochrome C domain-containing protein [Blastopirellula retiformator]TWT38967.1 Planctomycete cytochrome C [Blastopirellula retiformator]
MFIRTLTILSLLACCAAAFAEESIDVEQMKFFESKVRPLLASKCVTCHNGEKQKGDLRLDSLHGMLQGGESGAAVVPGSPDESLLIDAINYTSYEMPPNGQLSEHSIAILTKWVKMGAPWPEADSNLIRTSEKAFTDEDRNWWAIQPVEDPAVPAAGEGWARNEIDHFVARKLQETGLKPAPEADRHELVRRAYFDLHGLPPTPEQVAAFVNDDRPDAWQRLIRELLDSPRYGERWAQHWLDVVRFAESDGYNEDAFRPSAGAYRDYVIQSFNDDKPYNQFVREQLAGDEINPDDPNVFIGTSYLRLGIYEWNQRNARMHWDIIVNEMTRVTGEAFLGIGIGCAQCHDHKFDPILQRDYFGLQAFLSSVAWPLDRQLATKEEIDAFNQQQQKWEEATKAIRDEMAELTKGAMASNQKYIVGQFPDDIQEIYNKPEEEKTTYEKQLSYLVFRQAHRAAMRFDHEKSLKSKPEKLERYQALQEELKKFDSLKPQPLPNAFVASDIGTEPAPTYLLTRTTTEEVEPSFLALLGDETPKITPTSSTTGRRTALADWMVREENPLSTRVIVNRVWQRHLGKGIVPTPNDFGTLGDPPSHPELLDWLTSRFLEEGWQIKPLHELIMNSATYRQTARREPTVKESNLDPTNRLLWRYPPQRLDAEEVRDAQLAISGELQQRDGGSSVSGTSPYRSIFVKKMRNRPDEMLRGFDAPLGFESASERISTTTPLQSLLLVNGKWSLDRSRAFAKRLLAGKSELAADDVRQAYQLAYGRAATDEEVKGALAFVGQQVARIERSSPTPPKPQDKFPNETGLRPITQHFGSAKDLQLGEKSLWIQPGSRFERLHVQQADDFGDQFTVEAVVNLDRIYEDASVNTLLSRWNSGTKSNGWNIGVTSKKSAYHPQNFIVQLVGRTFQDEPAYEVVASGLTFPLGKPVYLAAAISATTSKENPTAGTVTFYMKDLSDPNAKLETSTVETSVVNKIRNPALKIIAGGRDAAGHLWDGQLARLTISQGALPQQRLLIGDQSADSERLLDWTFNGTDGEHPAPHTAWLRTAAKENSSDADNKMLSAVTDFCQALFNSNEFLYLH